jgi:hypothetical protein
MGPEKFVFAQLMDFVPRHDFDACVDTVETVGLAASPARIGFSASVVPRIAEPIS